MKGNKIWAYPKAKAVIGLRLETANKTLELLKVKLLLIEPKIKYIPKYVNIKKKNTFFNLALISLIITQKYFITNCCHKYYYNKWN